MERQAIAQWVQAALDHAGITQTALAEAMTNMLHRSIDKAAVNKMLIVKPKRGQKVRFVKADELLAIARITGYPRPGEDEHIESSAVLSASPPLGTGILEIDVRAGMGGGGTMEGRHVAHHGNQTDPVKEEAWHFPKKFMREELRAPVDRVIVIETQGDSMAPTLLSGDRVIVDTNHTVPSPDGIYAIRDQYGGIIVKRLQTMRGTKKIRVISDNESHDAEDVGPDQIAVIGRVLWGIKRL